MKHNKIISYKFLNEKQQDNLLSLVYFTEIQLDAINGYIEMTQELFDSIQQRRTEIGPVLENIADEIFFKYPEFAKCYGDKLEKELNPLGLTSPVSIDFSNDTLNSILRDSKH